LHNIVVYVVLAGGNGQLANVGLDACCEDFGARKNNVSEAQPECCAIALKIRVVAKQGVELPHGRCLREYSWSGPDKGVG